MLNSREALFRDFLYYRRFWDNEKVTILCEGHTDNIYLKAALSQLRNKYPTLIDSNGAENKSKVSFVEYSIRTRFLLDLHGGADYLQAFIRNYEKNTKRFNSLQPKKPVIIVLDNDSGAQGVINLLKSKMFKECIEVEPEVLKEAGELKKSEFIHVIKNLYVILTPLTTAGENTEIEDLFDAKTRNIKYNGKSFNGSDKQADGNLCKDTFAKQVVRRNKESIDFSGFELIFNSMVKVVKHYKTVASKG